MAECYEQLGPDTVNHPQVISQRFLVPILTRHDHPQIRNANEWRTAVRSDDLRQFAADVQDDAAVKPAVTFPEDGVEHAGHSFGHGASLAEALDRATLAGATMPRVPSASQNAAVITVLNLKGGVGKTHAAWLLASVCEERGKRCLLIDTDPQGNLSNSFLRQRAGVPGVERLLDPSQDADGLALVQRTAFEHIDLVPSSPLIARFDLADQRAWERAELHLSFLPIIKAAERLYDLIVFDCPPRLSLTSFAALCASQFVIVPMEAADWGAQGVSQVTEAVEYVQSHYNRDLAIAGYLVSRFKSRRAYQQTYLAGMREHFGQAVFDVTIDDLAAFERSVTDAIPITRHNPSSSAARIARQFFDEALQRIEKLSRSRKGGVPAVRQQKQPATAR